VAEQVTPGGLLVGGKLVRTYPETVFSLGSRGASTGQELQVTGLDLGNGEVDAARIASFNTNLPTRAPMRRARECQFTLPLDDQSDSLVRGAASLPRP
jgi:hypothetical protein